MMADDLHMLGRTEVPDEEANEEQVSHGLSIRIQYIVMQPGAWPWLEETLYGQRP